MRCLDTMLVGQLTIKRKVAELSRHPRFRWAESWMLTVGGLKVVTF